MFYTHVGVAKNCSAPLSCSSNTFELISFFQVVNMFTPTCDIPVEFLVCNSNSIQECRYLIFGYIMVPAAIYKGNKAN